MDECMMVQTPKYSKMQKTYNNDSNVEIQTARNDADDDDDDGKLVIDEGDEVAKEEPKGKDEFAALVLG